VNGPPFQAATGMAAAGERLGWALFLAAAAHGLLILGVGFAPPLVSGPDEVPTLEVTLLDAPVPDQEAPEDARYLAQASEHGGGNVEEHVRPEFHPRPPAPDAAEDSDQGAQTEPAAPVPERAAADRVATWRGPLRATIAPPETEPEARPPEAPPEGGLTRISAAERREHFVSVDARESVFAEYLAAWKARMERLGTLNFPTVARGQRSGNPVLEVALGADGHLEGVEVTRSSGHSALDQAAVELVRLASPFDPFPPAVRAQYDVLRFSYEWRFIEGRAGTGVLRAPER
jgi:periplasmic protein TonB